MSVAPPPLPPEPQSNSSRAAKFIVGVVVAVLVVGGLCVYLLFHYVTASGITRPIDNKFGDQHLKTTVALLELHKLRYVAILSLSAN